MSSTSFLNQTARHILTEQGSALQKTLVLLPNRTGIHFFRKALAQEAQSAVWAPVCLTPGTQMEKASGMVLGNKIRLAAELHRVYQQVLGREPESFERFFPWADLLINDFDDIDKYRADARILYANLAGLKNITEQFHFLTEEQIALIRRFWRSYEEPGITETKERFLKIWEKLYDVYTAFTQSLHQKGFGYEGLLHRTAAENPQKLFIGLEDIEAAYVIGFNRLNACEKTFFSELKKNVSTQFHYDVHPDVVSDLMHEGGRFYRETNRLFPGIKSNTEEEMNAPEIQLVNVSGSTSAVKFAAIEIAQALKKGQKPDEILVMLPDEKQMIPLLSSLPEELDHVNITSGLSLTETPVISLLRTIYNLRRTAVQKKQGTFFKIADVFRALQHPYLNLGYETANTEIIARLKTERRVRPERASLGKEKLHELLFSLWNETPYHETITEILRLILQSEQLPEFDKTVIQAACETAAGVSEVIKLEHLPSDDKASFMLLNNVMHAVRIPFEGEPVTGMQMMGPLETRNLDFKTVIIPAMGDDFFPGSGNPKTYIPFALRRAFGMPLPEDRSAELSHIFFRLLKRAEKVFLICNTSAGSLTTGEPSRFILRLEADEKYNKLLLRKSVIEKIKFKEPEHVQVDKSEAIMALLENLGERPVYPTAVNTYLDCSLRFYFRYLAKIKEDEDLSESADYAAFGSIFHWIMEWIYQDHVGKKLMAADIENLKGRFDGLVEKAFKQHFGYQENEEFEFEGENLIHREVIRKYVFGALDLDAAYAPFTITGLELGENETLKHLPVKFNSGAKQKEIYLAGKIDRVDEKDGVIRILDYKTGSDDLRYASIDSLFDRNEKKRNKAAFQTWLYGLIYNQTHSGGQALQAGVISVRELFKAGYDPILQEKISLENRNSGYRKVENLREREDEFREKLSELFEELFNPEIPFTQTEKVEKCATCPYNEICRR